MRSHVGCTYAYNFDRCPLVTELGWHTAWAGNDIVFDQIQIVCASCGTMHRLTEEEGTCNATTLPFPVRTVRSVILGDIAGEEIEATVWALETDWRAIGEHPGGLEAVGYCLAATASVSGEW